MAFETEIGPPAEDETIVTLEIAKKNSKIEFDDEDDLLQIFVDAATAEIENYIGAPVLLRNDSKFVVDKWFKSLKPEVRINEVTEISFIDADGETQIIPAEDYYLNKSSNTIVLEMEQPLGFQQPITIKCALGYADIPADIKRAALLIFSNADTYRENMPIKLNTAAQALLRPYKLY